VDEFAAALEVILADVEAARRAEEPLELEQLIDVGVRRSVTGAI
jgi:hypothetical protein